jgi:hypothetical protein
MAAAQQQQLAGVAATASAVPFVCKSVASGLTGSLAAASVLRSYSIVLETVNFRG